MTVHRQRAVEEPTVIRHGIRAVIWVWIVVSICMGLVAVPTTRGQEPDALSDPTDSNAVPDVAVPDATTGADETKESNELTGQAPVDNGLAEPSGLTWFAPDRYRGLLGVMSILILAWLASESRRRVSWRLVGTVLAFLLLFAVLVLRWPPGQSMMAWVGQGTVKVLSCADVGARFVFGEALVDRNGPAGFVFAFRVLPAIIFVAALFAVLYYMRIMPWVVQSLGWLMQRSLGTSGAESLNAAAAILLGQTESPLTIRPYLEGLTRSELFTLMVTGMTTVSGGVLLAFIEAGAEPRLVLTAVLMTAPSGILLSKLVIPETKEPATRGRVGVAEPTGDANLIDAAARGTTEGLILALNVAAVLIAFLALLALVDLLLQPLGLDLATILGVLLWPVAWTLGVPTADCQEVGGLLGTRAITNEIVAYLELNSILVDLNPRSVAITTVALCGFANLSSIGIQVGGIGALVPARRADLAQLGGKAVLAATGANLLSAAIAGLCL